jgi:hypothetical protein
MSDYLPPLAFDWTADDTAGRTEPETADVYADQWPPADWSDQPASDRLLDADVRYRLGVE